jgi:hypothetical protein
MNEVNINFVISKFFFIDILDELGLFIGENPIFTKKLRRSARFFEKCKK